MTLKRTLLAVATGLFLVAPVWARPYGMGPGMMHGDGWGQGYGHGHGMMGGMMGGCGMGPGMMWGDGPHDIDLSKEQRAKIAEIHREMRRKQWELMDKMHEQGWRSEEFDRDGKFDEQAARKAYDQMAASRKQMFENMLEARKRFDAVLTPQQREQLRRRPGGR